MKYIGWILAAGAVGVVAWVALRKPGPGGLGQQNVTTPPPGQKPPGQPPAPVTNEWGALGEAFRFGSELAKRGVFDEDEKPAARTASATKGIAA